MYFFGHFLSSHPPHFAFSSALIEFKLQLCSVQVGFYIDVHVHCINPGPQHLSGAQSCFTIPLFPNFCFCIGPAALLRSLCRDIFTWGMHTPLLSSQKVFTDKSTFNLQAPRVKERDLRAHRVFIKIIRMALFLQTGLTV